MPTDSRICLRLCDIRSNPMNSKNTDIANPASTSARSSPNGCRMEERFHTSKLWKTSTTTHIVADIASKKIRCDNAVRAKDPPAVYCTYAAIDAWQAHQTILCVCSLDIDARASLKVGIGRDAGRARGARGGGSRKT